MPAAHTAKSSKLVHSTSRPNTWHYRPRWAAAPYAGGRSIPAKMIAASQGKRGAARRTSELHMQNDFGTHVQQAGSNAAKSNRSVVSERPVPGCRMSTLQHYARAGASSPTAVLNGDAARLSHPVSCCSCGHDPIRQGHTEVVPTQGIPSGRACVHFYTSHRIQARTGMQSLAVSRRARHACVLADGRRRSSHGKTWPRPPQGLSYLKRLPPTRP